MKFNQILSSIEVLSVAIESIGLIASRASAKNYLIGVRSLCDLISEEYNNSLRHLNTEEEEKLDSEIEYLFIKLKELEDVFNERR